MNPRQRYCTYCGRLLRLDVFGGRAWGQCPKWNSFSDWLFNRSTLHDRSRWGDDPKIFKPRCFNPVNGAAIPVAEEKP